MSQLSIKQPHSLSTDEVRQQVEQLMASLKQKYGAKSQWQGDSKVTVKAPSIDGQLNFDSSSLNIEVKFGMLAGFMKPTIEAEIRNYLKKHIA